MNLRPSVVLQLLILLLGTSPTIKAGDSGVAPAAPQKLLSCVACHGADGIGKAEQYPDLRGQKAYYVEKQLRAFRSGERKDAAMSVVARELSDAEIAAFADYYASLQ